MIFILYTGIGSFITRTNFTVTQWNEKLYRFQKVVGFIDDKELLEELKFVYHLDHKDIECINSIIVKDNFKNIRFQNKAFEGFRYAENYFDFTNVKGQILYFEDWDFIFRRFNEEYFLWCFLGGIADIQREIKLSEEHIERYKEIGLAQIDYLIDDLKRLNNSIEYETAILQDRKLL
ncbi:hypothetical protein [Flavobacterium sp. SLB02]|uniref:hypothetical protein n=1 Tax=Flavobacterium sp. SLB02 TaxID=2665645 RepID=UPI0012A852B0|nr:hypothetical protein [Flavobacterium sp. SLB02]QGK75296.1 hypothetical protein GIY83_14790 [Flavobacterium sp. SLB02]